MAGSRAWVVAALAALLLFHPGGAAAASPARPLHARSADIADGVAQGTLLGVSWIANDAQSAPPLALSARHVEAALDRSDRLLSLGVASPIPSNDTTSSTARDDLQGGAAQAEAMARVLVLPRPGATATLRTGGAVEAFPGGATDLSFEPRASTRAPFAIPTSRALEVAPASRQVRIEGDFRVVVTGVDWSLTAADGPWTLQTKTEQQDYASAPGVLTASHIVVHEAILDVEGGVLVLPASQAFVAALDADTTRLALSGATGALAADGSQEATGQDVSASGALSAHLDNAGGGQIGAILGGQVRSLSLGGQEVALPRPASPSPWPWVATVAALAAAVAARPLLGRWRLRALDRSLDARDYASALAQARRLDRHPRLAQDGTLAQAVCHLGLGQPALARRVLDARQRWAAARRPMRDFLLARAAGSLGDDVEAARCLAASVTADPTLLAEASVDPVLGPRLRALAGAEAYS